MERPGINYFDPAPVLAHQRGETDAVFARRLGVTRATVIRWRTGRHRLYRKAADKVAAALGVDPTDLWPDEEEGVVVPGWEERALCRDSTVSFFPDDSAAVKVACDFCASCPVRRSCGEFALAHRLDHGVWGGWSAKERRKIIKARRLAAVAEKVA